MFVVAILLIYESSAIEMTHEKIRMMIPVAATDRDEMCLAWALGSAQRRTRRRTKFAAVFAA